MAPFFSIIIPLYNGESTLGENLKSIAGQTFTDYEIIFADGVSTDQTLRIIQNFEIANPQVKIKLKSEPDTGIYDAMNKGIAMASGDWLYFIGSDDTFYNDDVLSEVYKEIQKKEVDLVYGNVEAVPSKIKYVYDTENKVLSKGIHHQSVFYATRLFNELGPYDLRFKIASDYHFTLKVFLNNNYKTRYINKNICCFGEAGLSSQVYDYTFYSYHYKHLAINHGIAKIDDPVKCMETCIYCCLHLAQYKKDIFFAWANLMFYLTRENAFSVLFRMRTIGRMMMWTLKPLRKNHSA